MKDSSAYSGWKRKRGTKKSVFIADIVARFLISAGGIGTIIAVLGVCVFLVWVVIPLFQSAKVSEPNVLPSAWKQSQPIHVACDEYQAMGWMLMPTGIIQVFRVDTGERMFERQLFEGRAITSSAFLIRKPEAAIGFSDGTIRMIRIGFETSYLEEQDVPAEIRDPLEKRPRGEIGVWEDRVVQITPEGQYRLQRLIVEEVSTSKVSDTPIRLVDLVVRASGPMICYFAGTEAEPEFKAFSGKEKEDFMTGERVFKFGKPVSLPFESHGQSTPRFLEISGTGTHVYLAWEDGWMLRLRCESLRNAFIAEKGRLFEGDASLLTMGFVLGESTLVWGDSRGGVHGGFPVRIEDLESQGLYGVMRDRERARFAFAVTKELQSSGPAMAAMAASGRSRLILCGFDDGRVGLFNPTSEGRLAYLSVAENEPVAAISLSPKEDGFLVVTDKKAFHCHLDPMHPEANMAALFLSVWYEGYSKPLHMWQSSSGTDDFEPKLGLMPLIFGTLKATLYAMLFGAPLALLAAIYSSEFLHPRIKNIFKPTIELMASLPSVVLGFLAALVFAPYVEKILPGTLSTFITVPFAFLFAAYVWQLFPGGLTRQLESWRPLFVLVPMVLGVFLGLGLGPWVEGLLFGGDLKGWLAWNPDIEAAEGQQGTLGGWFLLWLPLCILITLIFVQRSLAPWVRRITSTMSKTMVVWFELLRFSVLALVTVGMALLISTLFSYLGVDPRSDWYFMAMDFSPMDVYVQRNALIVGFVMGFAVIPIIYTIADDALSSVPEHLRSASLGAGATKWQTATRIVIPTAMSGLFSALMIGLGRAVGETMIVLMALGNTAIMDWNIFNGARTLSANIAVELPEAVRNSSHYRTLFLAALVLFALTFVINTVAEWVRLRFRKRAYQL
jgi:phosphate transport system permease protein